MCVFILSDVINIDTDRKLVFILGELNLDKQNKMNMFKNFNLQLIIQT